MAKSKPYIEQLADWLQSQEGPPRPKQSLSVFLAIRPQIQDAIDAGYPLKTIWLHLRHLGKISVRYETFLRQVRTHLAPPAAPAHPSRSPQTPAAGFSFDPTPRKEDLY